MIYNENVHAKWRAVDNLTFENSDENIELTFDEYGLVAE
jgi:hypothetical protein